MPAALSYDPNDKELRKQADAELSARRVDCAKAWDYYESRHVKQLKSKQGKPDDNVVINLWKQGKDREITFLFPKMPGFELDEDSDAESPDEEWLRMAWAVNKGRKLLRRLAKYGAMTGHVFVRVMPTTKEGGYPRLIALNPANVLVFWKADDYDERLWYELHYTVAGVDHRQDIVKDEGAWRIIDYKRKRREPTQPEVEGSEWALVSEEAWGYELGPIVDWQHIDRPGQFYGDNEASLIPLQDKVNKVASDTGKILRYYASPKTVILSDVEPGKIVETAIEDAWQLPRESEVKNIEMKSDLAASVAFGQTLIDAMKAQQRVVVLTGSAADFQRVTNLGVQTVFIDQLAKTDELWDQYEPGLIDVSKVMLMLAKTEWDREIKVTRSSPLPTDPKETIDVQKEEIDLALVSRETIMRERGRNPKKERELIDEEDSSGDNAVIRAMKGDAFNTQNQPPRGAAQIVPQQQNGGQA